MDHQSIVEPSPAPSAVDGNVQGISATRSPSSVSAGIAAASAHQTKLAETGPRFPAGDGERSLAAMAGRDLDAALQLLAERAQYITGASGAMIALRRGEHNDMLCRASAGSSAPELGALLSMEYGFSGESVRTRQALRCDDADRDPRVNREGCRQLGIASVVVMPILSDQQVLGVFELFSGVPRAFEQRDLSALQRLSEMVETAVKYAVAAQTVPAVPQPALEEPQPLVDEIELEVDTVSSPANPDLLSAAASNQLPPAAVKSIELESTEPEKTEPEKTEVSPPVLTKQPQDAVPKPAEPTLKKPLFWSAAAQSPGDAGPTAEPDESMALPAVLRNLHKCQACGFPVSQGRKYCVECEEKQWRGQPLLKASAVNQVQPQPSASRSVYSAPKSPIPKEASSNKSSPAQPITQTKQETTARPETPIATAVTGPNLAASIPVNPATITAYTASASSSPKVATGVPQTPTPKSEHGRAADNALFLSATLESQSWLAANKYILGTLALVALIIAAIALLR